ncbi:MAG: HpaII family restriction endonuclease [Ruminococcus sp.]|nr:HpaII family restriction endonuclease [Ruminococcus sp.]
MVNAETGTEVCRVPIKDFTVQAKALYRGIATDHASEKEAFELPAVWKFAKSVGLTTIKAKSADKADITLMVTTSRTVRTIHSDSVSNHSLGVHRPCSTHLLLPTLPINLTARG